MVSVSNGRPSDKTNRFWMGIVYTVRFCFFRRPAEVIRQVKKKRNASINEDRSSHERFRPVSLTNGEYESSGHIWEIELCRAQKPGAGWPTWVLWKRRNLDVKSVVAKVMTGWQVESKLWLFLNDDPPPYSTLRCLKAQLSCLWENANEVFGEEEVTGNFGKTFQRGGTWMTQWGNAKQEV